MADRTPPPTPTPARNPAKGPKLNPPLSGWHLLLFGAVLIAGLTATLVLPVFPGQVAIEVGQPARADILAPRYFKYESPLLTAADQAKVKADPDILVYQADQTLIANERSDLLNLLSTIRDIRGPDATPSADKLQRMLTLPAAQLSETDADALLRLSSDEYGHLFVEVLAAYDLVMSTGRITDAHELERIRADLPAQFAASLPATARAPAARLLSPFLAINAHLDTPATEEAQRKAVAAVPPHVVEVQKGEAILRVGQIADDLALEKLAQAGLRNRDVSPGVLLASTGLIALLVLLLLIYLYRFQPQVWHSYRQLTLLALVMLAPMTVARFVVPGHALLPYLLPMATVSMLVAVLLDADLAIIVTLILSLLVSLISPGSVELPIYYLVTGMIGIFALWRAERATTFVGAGLYVAVGAFVAAVLLRFVTGAPMDQTAIVNLLGATAVNGGLAASLTFATFSVLGSMFGLTTVLQLLELAHPTQPLLRRLMHEAPGTYHHSLVVSNLAERAAELVGADPLLARVAAYYHDIGKVLNPSVFIDNQSGGLNVHDSLDPFTSARLIREHVTEGIKLATRYRLPHRVVDAIPQHHGTTLIKYFYHKALEQDPAVDEAIFRYPGPKPRTKENAILMLADSVEATVRSLAQSGQLRNLGPADCAQPNVAPDSIPGVVRKVIRERLEDGQLDESDLTVRDLARIQEAFCAMLVGIYHPRITYPERPVAPVPAPTLISASVPPAPGATAHGAPAHGAATNGTAPNGTGPHPPTLVEEPETAHDPTPSVS